MARELMPGLVAHCQHEGAALSIEFKGIKVYCHHCHDIFNLIKKSIEINNKLKNGGNHGSRSPNQNLG